MSTLERLKTQLAEFEKNDWESVAIEIRTKFAGIINKAFQEKGWTQKQLADASDMHESRVSKLLHGDDNCELNTIARILFALKVRVEVVEIVMAHDSHTNNPDETELILQDNTDGEESRWFQPLPEKRAEISRLTAAYSSVDYTQLVQPYLGGLNAGDVSRGRVSGRSRVQRHVRRHSDVG